MALVVAFVLTPLICYLTNGKYYIAREVDAFEPGHHKCILCQQEQDASDMAVCPVFSGSICSMCCSTEGRCEDRCKTESEFGVIDPIVRFIASVIGGGGDSPVVRRVVRFIVYFVGVLLLSGFILWTSYIIQTVGVGEEIVSVIRDTYTNVFSIIAVILLVGTWMILLLQESRESVELERALAEEELLEKESQLRMALENMPGAILVADKNLRVVLLNETYREYYGDAEGLAAPGTLIEDLIRAEIRLGTVRGEGDPEEILKHRMSSYQLDHTVNFEDRTPDGRHLQLARVPAPDGHTVTVAIDMSDRKKMEEALVEARNTAEAATEAKAEFLATMSHEIRTPMGGVMSMAEILDQTKLSSDQKSMTRTIRQSAQALLTVINDILDFSKIEAGKLDIEYIPFDMAEIVQSTADLLAPRADESSLELSVDIDLGLPKAMSGDPTRIRQILLNLGSNAIKFTSEGYVGFKVRRVTRQDKALVRIEVIDTGIGLTDEQKGKLFQAFAQADASTSRKFGGTGLGLSICKRLCEMMDGEIGVDTEPGVGSSFWFELPLNATEDALYGPAEDLKEARVLLVGYGDREATILRRYLDHGGVTHIAEAFSGLTQVPTLASALDQLGGAPTVTLVNGKPGLHGIGNELSSLDDHEGTQDAPVVVTAPHGLASTLTAKSLTGTKLKLLSTITVPQRYERLWHIVAVALGKAELGSDALTDENAVVVYTPPPLEDARQANAVILVAEDIETNQIVIRRILARLGFAFEIADDGMQALALYEDRAFGLLLTDFHMPEMDGFDLTAAIRERETEDADRGHLPIFALTADALPETEQQCADAGMEGYLRKPIEMPKLEAALEAYLPQALALRSVAQDETETETETETIDDDPFASIDPDIFDSTRLEDSFGPFDADAAEFVSNFLQTLGDQIAELDAALTKGDARKARGIAHAMKGSTSSVGAIRMGRIMGDIQDSLDDEDLETAVVFGEVLPETYEELKSVVDPLCQHFLA